jgi:hypothetical protein
VPRGAVAGPQYRAQAFEVASESSTIAPARGWSILAIDAITTQGA